MKAIIVAAGMGRRLRPYTDDRPKCMVEVAGKPILHRQLDALRAAGVHDVTVIRGYRGRAIRAPRGVRFVDNREFLTNNILMSLFSAGPELVGDVIVAYGDIVYHPALVQALVESPMSGTLVVDTHWKQVYEGRNDHPVAEAELCRLSSLDLVAEVGKQVGPEGALGEFIGLCRFSAPLTARLWARYLSVLAERGPDAPYGNAKTLRQAYLTDLINDAVKAGEPIGVLATEGGWREIDTVQDLQRAHEVVTW